MGKKFSGVIPPAVTVFNQQGDVDYKAMERHADFMIAGGVNGIAYLGTSGEFGVMTQAQKLEFIGRMTAYINHRVSVFIGVGDTCLTNTLELAREAQAAGADAVLAVAPYFSIYAEKNVEAYYGALAQAVQIPVIIYNFPALTGFDMNPKLVGRLIKQHSNIAGIKDTVEDVNHLKEMLLLKRECPDFSVFCAYETQALEMIQTGVDGFINATGNFAPELTAGLYQSAQTGKTKVMEQFFGKMCRAGDVYACATPLLLAVKEAVYQKVLGYHGYEKLPGLALDEDSKEKIARILNELSAD